MNMHNQFKTFILLCALHTMNSFPSAPAPQKTADIPASLQAELDRIFEMPDQEVFAAIVPVSRKWAELFLKGYKEKFLEMKSQLANLHAKYSRSQLVYWTIQKELASCNDGVHKHILEAKLCKVAAQLEAHEQEIRNHCHPNLVIASTYNFMENKYRALSNQASMLLVDKEDAEKKWQAKRALWLQEKAQLQQKEFRLQQEKKSLQDELNVYKAIIDGPQQIEGMPNVPGGVHPDDKPELKRSQSR